MRKLQDIDYEKIKKGIKNIEKSFSELNIENYNEKINFGDYFNSYYNGLNGNHR